MENKQPVTTDFMKPVLKTPTTREREHFNRPVYKHICTFYTETPEGTITM